VLGPYGARRGQAYERPRQAIHCRELRDGSDSLRIDGRQRQSFAPWSSTSASRGDHELQVMIRPKCPLSSHDRRDLDGEIIELSTICATVGRREASWGFIGSTTRCCLFATSSAASTSTPRCSASGRST